MVRSYGLAPALPGGPFPAGSHTSSIIAARTWWGIRSACSPGFISCVVSGSWRRLDHPSLNRSFVT
jgi:hypothetical protein